MAKKKAKKKARKKSVHIPEKKADVLFFMGKLIQAGHLQTIPDDNTDRTQLAQKIRQMATKLAQQTRKFK